MGGCSSRRAAAHSGTYPRARHRQSARPPGQASCTSGRWSAAEGSRRGGSGQAEQAVQQEVREQRAQPSGSGEMFWLAQSRASSEGGGGGEEGRGRSRSAVPAASRLTAPARPSLCGPAGSTWLQRAQRERAGEARGEAEGDSAQRSARLGDVRPAQSSPRRALSNALFRSNRRQGEDRNEDFCWTPLGLWRTETPRVIILFL